MSRVCLIVLDSAGVGELPDAAEFGDEGTNTFRHVDEYVGGMNIPNMKELGLFHIEGTGLREEQTENCELKGNFGKAKERGKAKDTVNGHFEIAGLIVETPFKVFGKAFPTRIIEELEKRIGTKLIGNYPASGTEIIQVLGDEHCKTGYPIIYLSADSVLQIAMHEKVIPLQRQYEICQIARELMTGDDTVGRVICRPFEGESGQYYRTENRKDFAVDPPGETVLDVLKANGKDVIAVGKIEDIFNHRGITKVNHTRNNHDGIEATLQYLDTDFDGLLFVNLVDFDMLYGHRNDPVGYAKALEYFDEHLPEIESKLREDDLLIITADHGCDPTTPGTDHTREYIPLLVYGKQIAKGVNLGVRDTFADIAATVADFLGCEFHSGTSFLGEISKKYEQVISGAIILSAHNQYEPFIGSVAVNGERIVKVTEELIDLEQCECWIDGTGKILMPGLINAHCHGDMTLARGLGDDLTLQEQNEAYADTEWFYSLITDEDRYASRQLTYCEALLSGTTFIMENMYWGLQEASVRAMTETGIKGALAEDIRKSFMQPDEFVEDSYLERFSALCKEKGIIPMLGVISEEDYDTERWKKILETARNHQMKITCHLAETTWREKIVQERFGTTSVNYLYKNKFLRSSMLGSHVVHLTNEEITHLSETETKVVNTPLCEMKISDGIAPIPEMIRQGVTVCLGTDGAMWNNSNDLFREMKGMSLLHTVTGGIRSLSKKEILDMATVNGAKCFGLEQEIGTIEEGKKADIILIETRKPHMQPLFLGVCENVTSAVIYNATGRDVTDVFVSGKHVVKNGVLQTVDVQQVTAQVCKAANKITDYLERKGNNQKGE